MVTDGVLAIIMAGGAGKKLKKRKGANWEIAQKGLHCLVTLIDIISAQTRNRCKHKWGVNQLLKIQKTGGETWQSSMQKLWTTQPTMHHWK